MEETEYINTIFYEDTEGAETVEMILNNETLWVNQKSMSKLFGVGIPAVNKHLKNIFETKELDENSVISKMEITASDGKKYKTKFYNLDAMISVGYRVNSKKATRFRQWATKVLKEYMTKGYVLDEDILKNGKRFTKDYFDELIEKIKEIRASERRFYQKLTDLFKACSYDYNPNSETARNFYKTVQNKFHYAITKQTAPEIIVSRADSSKPNMGLSSWKDSPDGKIQKFDTKIAKNYLTKDELSELNNLVNMYLDYAETQTRKHNAFTMKDWVLKLNSFLEFNDYDVLNSIGEISEDFVEKVASEEYSKFYSIYDLLYKSDFDKFCEENDMFNDT